MIISLDTETTGIDLAHGAMPFLVTTCCDEGVIRFWEWDVDPLTRLPDVPLEDVADIVELIDAAELIYLHNAKFDARALAKLGIALPWSKVRDSLISSHLLATNRPHDLTWLCIEYLGIDIEPHELNVKQVVKACRVIVKRDFPNWILADEGVPGMPSVKNSSGRDEDKPWKNDMWLPRALAKELGEAAALIYLHNSKAAALYDPNWLDACSQYANADSEHTLPLGLALEKLIREQGLWAIYEHRLNLPRADFEMEQYGITARGDYTASTILEYEQHVAEAEAETHSIADGLGHKLELAEGASLNDNMRRFFYGFVDQICPSAECKYEKQVKHWNGERAKVTVCPKCAARKRRPRQVQLVTVSRDNLALPVIKGKKTGNASLDGDAMKEYIQTLPDGPALDFIEILADKRMYDTALQYMTAYRRFWIAEAGHPGYYRIHASFNPCGTDHLRQSSNSPNMQNVSGESKQISNRACFGPLPGREWWRMDFKSIENRIPAYESGEEAMIELFERPKEPPFYGSYYLLNASITCPELFWPLAEREGAFKHEQPLAYKHVKFGTLAMQYGCGERKADRLYKMTGAYKLLKDKLPKLSALQQHYISKAERDGYVETLPDRTVDPKRGYPILASRMENGRVLSTTPFNYHVSGTACWCKNQALIRCVDQCAAWQAEGFDAHVVIEVHDELLFDFPRGATMEENLPRARVLQGIMERSGEDLIPRIPTPVSCEYHVDSWAEGVSI